MSAHRPYRGVIVVEAAHVDEANALAPLIDSGPGAMFNFGRVWFSTGEGAQSHSWMDSRFSEEQRAFVLALEQQYSWGRAFWGEDGAALQQALKSYDATIWSPEE